jgi:hypothetical protein
MKFNAKFIRIQAFDTRVKVIDTRVKVTPYMN